MILFPLLPFGVIVNNNPNAGAWGNLQPWYSISPSLPRLCRNGVLVAIAIVIAITIVPHASIHQSAVVFLIFHRNI